MRYLLLSVLVVCMVGIMTIPIVSGTIAQNDDTLRYSNAEFGFNFSFMPSSEWHITEYDFADRTMDTTGKENRCEADGNIDCHSIALVMKNNSGSIIFKAFETNDTTFEEFFTPRLENYHWRAENDVTVDDFSESGVVLIGFDILSEEHSKINGYDGIKITAAHYEYEEEDRTTSNISGCMDGTGIGNIPCRVKAPAPPGIAYWKSMCRPGNLSACDGAQIQSICVAAGYTSAECRYAVAYLPEVVCDPQTKICKRISSDEKEPDSLRTCLHEKDMNCKKRIDDPSPSDATYKTVVAEFEQVILHTPNFYYVITYTSNQGSFDREGLLDFNNIISSFMIMPSATATGGCLIATATFGSEMAPQVQFLRELRDNTVLQTESGTLFMAGFNQFYYSFSPAIADYERENPAFKEAVKLTLTPLLASLALLQYADIDSESEMLGYGIGVILLNIGMYFVAPAVLIMAVRKRI